MWYQPEHQGNKHTDTLETQTPAGKSQSGHKLGKSWSTRHAPKSTLNVYNPDDLLNIRPGQQYFSLRTNQPPATSQQYFSQPNEQVHLSCSNTQALRCFHTSQDTINIRELCPFVASFGAAKMAFRHQLEKRINKGSGARCSHLGHKMDKPLGGAILFYPTDQPSWLDYEAPTR
jgi:hypothetical protein